MDVQEQIESMILEEVKGLCRNCANAPTCVYFQTANKEVIQCELFQLDIDGTGNVLRGLCATCDHASTCKLPGRHSGVWRCNEFL